MAAVPQEGTLSCFSESFQPGHFHLCPSFRCPCEQDLGAAWGVGMGEGRQAELFFLKV